MKKIYLLISLVILFLSGCGNPYATIDEQNKKIEELNNKIVNNDLAEKEKRCTSYENEIKNKLREEVNLLTNPSSDHFWALSLKEEFYSSKLDTCAYVTVKELYDGPTLVLQDYIVRDYYNEKELNTFTIVEQRYSTGNLGKFEDYILDLKK